MRYGYYQIPIDLFIYTYDTKNGMFYCYFNWTEDLYTNFHKYPEECLLTFSCNNILNKQGSKLYRTAISKIIYEELKNFKKIG